MENKNNPSFRKLRKSEFSNIEQKYTVDKNFAFTGEKVENYDDVAFIFKSLQNSSIENTFVLYEFEDKRPFIQHIAMGTNSAALVNYPAISDGINRFSPKKVHFIHNHPSGKLKCSNNDVEILKLLKENFGDIVQDGIIINTITGRYAIYDVNSSVTTSQILTPLDKNKIDKIKVLKFDRAVFSKDVDYTKIGSSKDVASFVSSMRFSTRKKLSMLILDRSNKITANIHLPYSIIKRNKENLLNDIKAYIPRFAGSSCILYGRQNVLNRQDTENADTLKQINNALKPMGMPILDCINLEYQPIIDDYSYKSAADDGLLYEEKSEYKKRVPSPAPKVEIKESEQKKGRGLEM